mmetsp:Transcript_39173/g.75079  ORF Transcript_39173/g.75079 Transcript_39173/m.75079 type:complete len:326 (-) Transcript_39173:334-1311(-)|eukprot:CAMPEP_0114227584 /NCGR_PEP_ID=MMETSP0058-20121206/1869_1 /TAXON_ID=36894 /ORGANISM="Pyramimonas parkeae, CCMP726" /LENGTH=325 /DNA_ID=CAMNT_0001338437 /DNA_START=196 /DNA_END=1173 /DNA_ORIENTATION=-
MNASGVFKHAKRRVFTSFFTMLILAPAVTAMYSGAGGVEIRGGGGGNPARRLQQQGEEQGDAWRVQGQAEGQADYPDYPGGSDATTPTPDPNVPSPTLYTPWTHPSLLPNGTPDPSMPTQAPGLGDSDDAPAAPSPTPRLDTGINLLIGNLMTWTKAPTPLPPWKRTTAAPTTTAGREQVPTAPTTPAPPSGPPMPALPSVPDGQTQGAPTVENFAGGQWWVPPAPTTPAAGTATTTHPAFPPRPAFPPFPDTAASSLGDARRGLLPLVGCIIGLAAVVIVAAVLVARHRRRQGKATPESNGETTHLLQVNRSADIVNYNSVEKV